MEIYWLIFCAIVIWVWFYKGTKRDNNGSVDFFEIVLITVFSAMISLLGNLAIGFAYAVMVMIYNTPIKITLSTLIFLFFIFWLFKKLENLLSWIDRCKERYVAKKEREKPLWEQRRGYDGFKGPRFY